MIATYLVQNLFCLTADPMIAPRYAILSINSYLGIGVSDISDYLHTMGLYFVFCMQDE